MKIFKTDKMKHTIYSIALLAIAAMPLSSCDDLDQTPHIETTSESVYTSVEKYKSVLGQLYSVFSLNSGISSNKGEGYMRCYFNLQEVCTDEIVYSWLNGDNLNDIHDMNWDSQDVWVADTYYWTYYSIALCNEFLRNTQNIGSFSEADQKTINQYAAEARFLRALSYWHVLDLFRKGAFVTENDPVGAYVPNVADATQLFNYIESELKEISELMPSRTEQEYGRAPRAAAWMLLARLYLNAITYGQAEHYTDCITYSQKVIDEGYSLHSNYAQLFNADNDKRTDEIIFHLQSDATNHISWGVSSYIVCGCPSPSSSQNPANYGVTSAWGMWRATSQAIALFNDYPADVRNTFYTDGQTYPITDTYDQSQGYFFEKWTNLTDDGLQASNTGDFGVNTDFPMFRTAEAYLNIAEAIVRGGTGATLTADEAINAIRQRAGIVNISGATLTDVFNERSREFQLECMRRTDLIRFGKFIIGGWDCGPKNKEEKYKYYPIPQTELTANPNLTNEEY